MKTGCKRMGMFFLVLAVHGVALAQKPEIVVQTGHLNVVTAVAFSPDGQRLASSSIDRTVKLWDIETGRQLRTLTAQSVFFFAVAFSPDGRVLAGGGNDRSVRLWDVATGRELRAFSGLEGNIAALAFSPDGALLAGAGQSQSVAVWRVADGALAYRLTGHTDTVSAVAFSPDARLMATASADKTIKLWDAATGREIRALAGHTAKLTNIAFSPDGRWLASADTSGQIKLWDTASGRELQSFATHDSEVIKVGFSRDGTRLVSGAMHAIKVWDVASAKEIRAITGRRLNAYSMALAADGQRLAVGGLDRTIRFWDMATGENVQTFAGSSYGVNRLAFSGNGRMLAATRLDALKVWDFVSGRQLHTLEPPFGHSILSVAFSPDGGVIATGSRFQKELFGGLSAAAKQQLGLTEEASSIKLWDARTGQLIRTLMGHSERIDALAFSPDGKRLASGSGDKTIKLWDATTGAELRTLTGHQGPVKSLAFRNDGRVLASGGEDKTVRLWDVDSGKPIRAIDAGDKEVTVVAFSPDGRIIASGGWLAATLWDATTGLPVRRLEGHTNMVNDVAFSPDGKTIATGGFDKTVKVWDAATGVEMRTLAGHSDTVTAITFHPRGQWLATGSFDSTVKLWDATTGKEAANLIALDGRDWLAATSEGLFDGSPAAWSRILWRFEQNTFNVAPVEAFFNEFYSPGLLADLMAKGHLTAPRNIAALDRRQPTVKLTLDDQTPAADKLTTRNVTVRVEVRQAPADATHRQPGGARDVRLFRNGSLVKLWPGNALPKGKDTVVLQATIPIIAGKNQLTAYAFNRDNIKSSDATLVIAGDASLKRAGTAYILTLGINEYANADFNLRYAVRDAEALGEALKQEVARLDVYSRVEVVPLFNGEATKANLLRALARFAGTDQRAIAADNALSRIQPAQPEDTLVIYFAGHGKTEGERFYLLPHDIGYAGRLSELGEAGLQTILRHGVSDIEIERAFEAIDAGQIVMIIDACNSGQLLESNERRRGPMNSKGLAQLAYEKGMWILTAAQGHQAALEAEKFGHGYLTYALVEEGLRQHAADRAPKDNLLTLAEWLDYAAQRVPQMQVETLRSARGLKIAFVDGETKITDADERTVQRPRVFYRRDANDQMMIIAKPPASELHKP